MKLARRFPTGSTQSGANSKRTLDVTHTNYPERDNLEDLMEAGRR
jgi:hypothetical protein